MDFQNLENLDKKLKENFPSYLSMIAVGSVVTGDPYVKGRSDKDIVLIFDRDPVDLFESIEAILGSFSFDESYIFTPIGKKYWGRPDSKYTFSNAFRSKTLFGKDFVKLAILPSGEEVKKIYSGGLESVYHRILNYLVNSKSWSAEKTRDKFWKQFKHTFMYLAIREYYLTGNYPKTRKEISERLNSKEIWRMFEVLHSIDSKSKGEIIECARDLVGYLNIKA